MVTISFSVNPVRLPVLKYEYRTAICLRVILLCNTNILRFKNVEKTFIHDQELKFCKPEDSVSLTFGYNEGNRTPEYSSSTISASESMGGGGYTFHFISYSCECISIQ